MRTENVLRWITIGCAAFLLLGIAMPDWLARTSWERGSRNRGTIMFDSPAGYVGLVSLCGIVAFVALAVGLWRRRWAAAATLASAAALAFAFGAYVAGSYWLGLSRGVALLEGRWDPGPKWTVHWPPALPFFVFAAIVGAMSALVLAVSWLRHPEGS